MTLADDIKSTRTIKEKSLNAYMGSLKKIYKEVIGDDNIDSDTFNNANFLKKKHYKKVSDFLDTLKLPTKKNYLSSILVALTVEPEKNEKIIQEYRNNLDIIASAYTEQIKTQMKSKKLETNWTSMEKLKKIVGKYKRNIREEGLLTKETWDKKELELYKMYLVGSLYTLIPPVRNDYADMKIINFKEYNKLKDKTDNYLVVVGRSKKFFSFGAYKTSDLYGVQINQIPSELNRIINKWLEHNKSDYFLINKQGNPVGDNSLTKLINKTFAPSGRKVGSTLIRHVYLSEKYSDVNDEKEKDAKAMHHSVATQNDYIKK